MRKGNYEIEVQGNQEFVEDKFSELKEDVRTWLSKDVSSILEITETVPRKTALIESSAVEIEGRVAELAKRVGTSIEQLQNVVEFEKEKFHLIKALPFPSMKEKQQKASLIILTVGKLCYGVDEMRATEISSIMENIGVSSANYAYAMSQIRQEVLGKGAGKGTVYRITIPGVKKGLEIIKEIATSS